jgi:hypothetical protein
MKSQMLFFVAFCGITLAPAPSPAATLVFSVRTWQGDYASKDCNAPLKLDHQNAVLIVGQNQ